MSLSVTIEPTIDDIRLQRCSLTPYPAQGVCTVLRLDPSTVLTFYEGYSGIGPVALANHLRNLADQLDAAAESINIPAEVAS